MNNQPKTWDELKDAGYVTELTEKQIKDFKARTKPKLKDLKAQALNFGVTAFKSGLKSVPHHDVEFNKFLNSGLVPEGRRILMYKAWAKGWHGMNASTNGGV